MSSHSNNIYIDPSTLAPPTRTHTTSSLFFFLPPPLSRIPHSPNPSSARLLNNLISYWWRPGQVVYDCSAALLGCPDCFQRLLLQRGEKKKWSPSASRLINTRMHAKTSLHYKSKKVNFVTEGGKKKKECAYIYMHILYACVTKPLENRHWQAGWTVQRKTWPWYHFLFCRSWSIQMYSTEWIPFIMKAD